MSEEMVTITVNGKEAKVPKGMLLVEAAKAANVEIPVFCHHPKLDPAGVCRMCLVEVEGQRKPLTACTTPVSDGMVVNTESPLIQDLQRGVLEFLLLNHPLDCPVCDKGGECPLQDNTFKYGPATSRSLDLKVRKDKAVDLGNFIVFDQERCILCRRCTRFDDEISQEQHLVVAERAHENIITTADGKPFNSYFSGNTIEMCPVGALTSEVFRFKARPWDLTRVPAVCTGCSVGCNVFLDFRFGELQRVISRENPDIDDGWLCDRGRFNYRYIHSEDRIEKPMIRKDGQLVEVSWEEALNEVALNLRNIRRDHGGEALGAIGGGRLTNEEAYLFQKLMRAGLTSPNVDWRTSEQYVSSNDEFPGRIKDISRATGVLLVDILLQERAPVADLRVRRVAERGGATLASVGSAQQAYRPDCRHFPALPEEIAGVLQGDELFSLYQGTERLVVLWSGRNEAVGTALLDLLRRLKEAGSEVHLLIPGEQANTRGAEALGMRPDVLPGYRSIDDEETRAQFEQAWQADLPEGVGLDVRGMLEKAAAGQLQGLYLAGANIMDTYPDRALAEAALERLPFVVVQDLFLTETAKKADVILPVTSFTEKSGHYTAFDGTVQPIGEAVMRESGESRSDRAIFQGVARALGIELIGSDQELVWEMEHLTGWNVLERLEAAPSALTTISAEESTKVVTPSKNGRASASLRIVPVERLFSGGGTSYFDPDIAHARPRSEAFFHPADALRLKIESGQSVALENEKGSITYTAVIDPSVMEGTVQVPKALAEAPVNTFGHGLQAVVSVEKRVAKEVG